MAAESGAHDLAVAPSDVQARLEREPFAFEFFQAVRLLAKFQAGRNLVGRFHNPATEAVRFSANPTLTFPASEIQSLVRRDDAPHWMSVNFMGLIGPLGVLPLYYTELVMERMRSRDTTMRDFFDIFQHRAISLFYQAWEKYRFPIAYERREPDRFSQILLSFAGLGTPGIQRRQAVPDESLLFYGGLLVQQPRSAVALQQLLGDYFDVPVEIEQFVGAWYRLDPATQTRMNDLPDRSGQLGCGAVLGDEVWDPQSRVRIKLGPLTLDRYLDFLPSGTAYAPLRAITRFFSGDAVDFEVQLILEREHVPACELGADGEQAPRLGWLTWVRSVPMCRDAGETVLRL